MAENRVKVKGILLFPVVTGVIAIIGTLALWQLLSREVHSHAEQLTCLKLTSTKNELIAHMDYKILSLLRMAKRWEIQGGTPKDAWASDASFYVKHLTGIQAIEWVDSSFHVRWIVPLEGNEAALGFDLSSEDRRRTAMEKARDTGEITITSAIDLVQGEKGFLVYVPIFKGKDFEGFILGVFRFKELFDTVFKNIASGYSIAVIVNDEEIYRREVPDKQDEKRWGRETNIDLYGVVWHVRVCPGATQFSQIHSYIPEWGLVYGVLISILLALMVYFLQTTRLGVKRLDLVNRELAHDISERNRAEDALREQMRLAAFVADVGIILTQGKTLQNALQGCAEAMVKHLDAAFARIWTLNSEGKTLELQASAGMYTHIDGAHSRVPVGKFKIGLIAEDRKPHLTNTVIGDPRVHDQEWAKREGMVAFAGYPLIIEGVAVGVIAMFSRKQLNEVILEALGSVADTIALGIRQKQTAEMLQESEERFRSIAQTAIDAIISADSSGNIISWNKGAQTIFGYSEEEVLGKPITPLMPGRYRDAHVKGIERVFLTDETKITGKTIEVHGLKKDGSEFPMELSISNWKTGKGTFYTAIIRDIAERRRMAEELRVLSLVDELTGLSNRRGFLTLAKQQLKIADRFKREILLFFVDLDDLKKINDAMGHQEGDFALIDTAKILKETFRESDIIARIGGDEFVVLMMENTNTDAHILSNRLQENIKFHNKKGSRRFKMSVSMGIARYNPGRPCSIDELLAQADKLMYEQKMGKKEI